jgi:hypothetical protein
MRKEILMIALSVFTLFIGFTYQIDHLKNAPGARLLISIYFAIFAADGWFIAIQLKNEMDRLFSWLSRKPSIRLTHYDRKREP